MRTILLVLAVVGVLLLALAGYGLITNPKGCAQLGTDFIAIYFPPAPAPPAKVAVTDKDKPKPASPVKTLVKPATTTPATASATVSAEMKLPATTNTGAPVAPSADMAAVDVSAPQPEAFKQWVPPAVMPAQPNWTWVTPDKTYQNVVVTKIEPETVAITHSMGVAHIPIATLTPELQKQLNFDPAAAVAAKAETERETENPYYSLPALAEAQAVAHQLHWPLAWVCSDIATLKAVNPPPNSEDELTQMAMSTLKTRTVVIFLNSNEDLAKAPPVLIQKGFFQMDDGPIPDGHHFFAPKIVFSDADATKYLGRVSKTQLLSSRSSAIESALQALVDKPAAITPAPAAPATPAASAR